MVTSPLLILWPELNDEETMNNLLWLNELVFALDILRKFIDKPKKSRAVDSYEIAVAYIKSTLFIDVIATLPQVASGLNQKFLSFKIVRLFNYLWALHYPFEALVQICYSDKDQRHNFVVTDAYRTLCRIVMLLHYLAIIWIWLGSPVFSGYEQDYEPWQMANEDFEGYTRYRIYIFSVYWVCTVVTTVGYGDYSGGTTLELIFTIMLELFGVIVFAKVQIAVQ